MTRATRVSRVFVLEACALEALATLAALETPAFSRDRNPCSWESHEVF